MIVELVAVVLRVDRELAYSVVGVVVLEAAAGAISFPFLAYSGPTRGHTTDRRERGESTHRPRP